MPAFRCASTIAADVAALAAVLDQCVSSYEILVILDGDGDDGASREAAASIRWDGVAVWEYEGNRGKGFAVVFGMLHARGDLVGFIDAGGDIDPRVWFELIDEQRATAADAVIASKRHPRSAVHYPLLRRLYSMGYQLMTAVLFGLPVRDTQTGAKLFSASLVRTVAPRVLVKRFAFDVELLAVARHFGFRRIREVPVTVHYDFNSSIRTSDVFRMAWDSAAVFYRLHLLRYYDRPSIQPLSPSVGSLLTSPAAMPVESLAGPVA